MKKTHQMVEKALIAGLLKGEPQPGSCLQSERDLALRFAVSRATVREALLKLQHAGWISVQQRHATIVNDFWRQGDLALLSSITRNNDLLPADLASHLLELRVQSAPYYARRAVENNAEQLVSCLSRSHKLRNSSSATVRFDWELHLSMAVWSGNKIYPLVMNSLAHLYAKLQGELFAKEEDRAEARCFYGELLQAAGTGDADHAADITRAAMKLAQEKYEENHLRGKGPA